MGLKYQTCAIIIRIECLLPVFIDFPKKNSSHSKIQAIQNSAVRFILKLKYDTPSDILHNEAFDKLKLLKVSNRLFELAERYVGVGLSHSVPLVTRLVE
ncbi:hypothetical protein BpHYR1_044034, partial [Brachionus plicatilis]